MPDTLFALDGKTAVIVGGGSGIGEAVAAGAAAQGARVFVLDANEPAAGAVASRIGGGARAQRLDICDAPAVRVCFEAAIAETGRLDIVVCTPGINVRKPILDYAGDEFDRVVALNLKGSFNVLQAAGRIMVARRAGSIVIFSSIRSRVVEPGQSVYAEFGPAGVRVNAVAPGVVETPLTAPIKANPEWYNAYRAKSALQRWARAEEMVGPTLFLASDAASYVTGTVLFADGGWTAADGRFTPPL